jgi:hypothetical protein
VLHELVAGRLTTGAEMKLEHRTDQRGRGDGAIELLLGPSVQWSPLHRINLRAAPLFGLTGNSPQIEASAILELELWEPNGH